MAEQVKVGQVWRDNDVRMGVRLLRVERTDEKFGYCILVNAESFRPLSHRPIRIMLRRFKSGSRGFTLWHEGDNA